MARADPGRELRVVSGTSRCPDPADVVAVLRPLLPGIDLSVGAGNEAAQVRVEDLGADYSVSVDGKVRSFGDAALRCDERARAAAVYIALLFAPSSSVPETPPSEGSPSPSPTSPASQPAEARPLPPGPAAPGPPPRLRRLEVDVDLALTVSGSGDGGASWGGEARVVLASGPLGGSLGLGASSPVSIALTAGGARLLRAPFDLSMRARYRRGRFELAGDLGFDAMLVAATGEGIPRAVQGLTVDLGLRAALQGRVWAARRLAVGLGLEALAFPAPTRLAIHDAGIVGRTPFYWIGAMLTLVARAR